MTEALPPGEEDGPLQTLRGVKRDITCALLINIVMIVATGFLLMQSQTFVRWVCFLGQCVFLYVNFGGYRKAARLKDDESNV